MSKVKISIYLTQDQYDFLNDLVYEDFKKNNKVSVKKDMTKSRNAFIVDMIDKLMPVQEEFI